MAATIGNNCVKQLTLIRKDLESLASSSSAATKGQISTSLSHLAENLTSYEQLTKTEQNAQKQEKQQIRLKDLRHQYEDVKSQYHSITRKLENEALQSSRQELLGRRPHHNATPENPYSRQEGNLKEAGSLHRVSNVLDEYIESGLASLSDIRDQNATMKGTQRKLRDVAVGLGISGDTIRMVERRVKSDKYVFYGGCVITLVCFYFILRWFG